MGLIVNPGGECLNLLLTIARSKSTIWGDRFVDKHNVKGGERSQQELMKRGPQAFTRLRALEFSNLNCERFISWCRSPGPIVVKGRRPNRPPELGSSKPYRMLQYCRNTWFCS